MRKLFSILIKTLNMYLIALNMILAPIANSHASTDQLNLITLLNSEVVDQTNPLLVKLHERSKKSLQDLHSIEKFLVRKNLGMERFELMIKKGLSKISKRVIHRTKTKHISYSDADQVINSLKEKMSSTKNKAGEIIESNTLTSKEKIENLQKIQLSNLESHIFSKVHEARTPVEFIQNLKRKLKKDHQLIVKTDVEKVGRHIANDDGGIIAGTAFLSFFITVLLICIVVLILGPIAIVITTTFAWWVVGITAAALLSVPIGFGISDLVDSF